MNYQIFSIVDAPKKIIMLIFDKIQFKIVIFSKIIMKNKVTFYLKIEIKEDGLEHTYLFPKNLQSIRLVDEEGKPMESYFQ